MKTLLDAKKNQKVIISNIIESDPALARRYCELGLIIGEKIEVICKAPKNSSVLICVRGYSLALDSNTCKKVIINE